MLSLLVFTLLVSLAVIAANLFSEDAAATASSTSPTVTTVATNQ